MENLNNSGLVDLLTEEVIANRKPFIGICLGMQLVATYGNEPEKVKGLGWIEGEVVKIEFSKKLRVPHLGWNAVNTVNSKELYTFFRSKRLLFYTQLPL